MFLAFLCGLLAMNRFFRRERRLLLLATSCLGAAAVAVTLTLDLARGYPLASLTAALAIAGGLYVRWARTGRGQWVASAERIAEKDLGPEHRFRA